MNLLPIPVFVAGIVAVIRGLLAGRSGNVSWGLALLGWGFFLAGVRATWLIVPLAIAALAFGLQALRGSAARAQAALGAILALSLLFLQARQPVLGPPPTPPSGSETIESRRFNFRFTPPGLPWVPLDPRQMGDDSVVYLMRTRPSLFVTLRADIGDSDTSLQAIAETMKGRLRSEGKSFKVSREDSWPIHGLAGLRVLREERGRLRRLDWLYSRLGFVYELSAWGEEAKVSEEQLIKEATTAFAGFDMLDRERVASPDGGEAQAFHSRVYGYDVAPPGRQWREWKSVERDVPGAEYGLVSDNDASLAIIPVALLGRDPDLPILTRSLFQQLDIEYPNSSLGTCHTISLGDLAGCEYDYEGDSDGVASLFKLRVLKGHGCGYLLAAWIPKGSESKKDEVAKALSLVSFRSSVGTPTLELLPPEARRSNGRLFNEMGLAYYENEQYEDALKAFRLAFELDEVEAVFLQNVVETYTALGRYREALDYLDRHIRGFPHAIALKEWKAYLKEQVDQDKAEGLGNKSALASPFFGPAQIGGAFAPVPRLGPRGPRRTA